MAAGPGHLTLNHAMIDRPGEPSLDGIVVLFYPNGEGLEFWQSPPCRSGQPGISPLPFSFVDHQYNILKEVTRLFQGSACLTESSQIFSLDLIKLFWLTYKQSKSGIGGPFLQTTYVD